MQRSRIILLALWLLPLPAWGADLPLFAIQRNKNANEVQYRLHVDDHCQIVTDKPVDAVWKLLAESPEKTAPLTDLEQMVYGAVNQKVADNWVTFDLGVLEHVRLLAPWSVKATAVADPHTATCTPLVQTTIQGQVATLERMYVQAEEGLVKPKVRYIDLFGKRGEAPATPVTERLTP